MSENIILANDGRACMPIIISRKADRLVCFAARELRKYLQKISKATFTIKKCSDIDTSPSFSAIVVGAGEWEKKLDFNLDPACAPFDGFTIRSFHNKLFIRGVNSRSSLYGVYAVLEKLGCEFVEPGIEHVPGIKEIILPKLNVKEVSAFPLRNLYMAADAVQKQGNDDVRNLNAEKTIPEIDWMAKKRLNHFDLYINHYRYDLWEKRKHQVLDALLDRGFDLEVTHHSIHYFCPPDENHDFGEYGPETYIYNHPDWYEPALECGARGRHQTRVNIAAVQKIIIKRFLEYIDRNPELKIIGLWPADIPMNAPYKGMSVTDGYMKFWNKVGKVLAKEFPEKRLAICGYFELANPPETVIPLANLHQWFCPISRNYNYPIGHVRSRQTRTQLRKWVLAMSPYHLGIFEYYSWQMPFKPLREVMREDLRVYRQMGVGGIYGWASGYPTTMFDNILGMDKRWALDYFVLTHLLWNTEADLKKLERIWAENVFGDVADLILDFYDLLKKHHAVEVKKRLSPSYEWISFDLMHMCQKLLVSARKKAESQRVIDRINLLEKVLVRGSAEMIMREGK